MRCWTECGETLLLDQDHTDKHSLAHLTGDVRLQAPGEDLVDDAVTVVRVVGFLPVVVCVGIKHTHTQTQSLVSAL